MSVNLDIPFTNLNDNQFSNFIRFCQFNSNFDYEHLSLEILNSKVFDQFNTFDDSCEDNYNDNDPNNFFLHQANHINDTKYYLHDDIEHIKSKLNCDSFSIFSFNINSLPKHFDQFLDDFYHNFNTTCRNFDIFGFTETKLSNEIDHLYELPGYKKYLNNCRRNSGGVAMFVRNELPGHRERSDLRRSTESLECLFIEFDGKPKTTLCGLIYHRPNCNNNEFIEELTNLINIIKNENKIIHLMGDFNVDLLGWPGTCISRDLLNLAHGNNLFSLINKPTRVSNTSSTIIDHIWSNYYLNVKNSGILYSTITDHFPVFAVFDCGEITQQNNNDRITYSYRDFSDYRINKFKMDLSETDWHLAMVSDDPNISFDNFFLIFKSLFNKNFPILTKTINKNHFNKFSITDEIKELIKKRNKLQRKYAKRPITYGTEYRTLRNKINKLIKQSKSQYFKNKLNNLSGRPKETWRVIDDVLKRRVNDGIANSEFKIDNVTVNNSQIIVNAFNDHYVNVGRQLADRIPQSPFHFTDFLENNENLSFNIPLITEQEIIEIVKSFSDSAPGHDEIPVKIIKPVIDYISHPLKHIFNRSIVEGKFIQHFKTAKVIPIFKKGSKDLITNYRPISILSTFSKIIEKHVANYLTSYLDNNNLMSDNQFGFRQQRSIPQQPY